MHRDSVEDARYRAIWKLERQVEKGNCEIECSIGLHMLSIEMKKAVVTYVIHRDEEICGKDKILHQLSHRVASGIINYPTELRLEFMRCALIWKIERQ
jgi:riboflavin synthase